MTDPRQAAEPIGSMSPDELAARTGVPVSRIDELTAEGVLRPIAPNRHAAGDVHRVRVIGAFETAGITIEALVAASHQGRVSFAYYDELHRVPGPVSDRTYAEFRTSLGALGERLPSLFVAFGLAEPDQTTRLEADEEAFLADLLQMMDDTHTPDVALRVMRLYGDAAGRAAKAALGLYEDVLAQLGEAVALASMPPEEEYVRVFRPWARLARKVPDLASYLAGQHISRAIDAFSAEATERILAEAGFVAERHEVEPGVAFIDLTGFTRLSEERGDRAAATIAIQLGEIARETAARHDGRVVKLLGDGVLLRFPDAARAVEATLDLLAALPAAGLPSGHAGVHNGPLIEREGDVFGRSVNLAARVSDVAPPGELYVTDAVARALERSPRRLEPVAPSDLQGIGMVALYRVVPG